ncbi:MAG: ArnT family glycosyltransferase, partial [Polyangia bacterium]
MSPPPERASFSQALRWALLFAALKLAAQTVINVVGQHAGYGIFRDELYYLVCGRHLAWGYVDQQPLVALQARLAELLFGVGRLALLRIFSALAGAAMVLLTGLITFRLGGRRLAQTLAMIAVLAAPEYLGTDSYLSMNAFEPMFWMLCLLALFEIVERSDEIEIRNRWIVCGLSGGLALENKLSAVFFLGSLLGALLLTQKRRLLWSRGFLLAVSILVAIALPSFIWQVTHGFPTLVWLSNVAHSHKNVRLGPAAFLKNQVFILGPLSVFLWASGLGWLLLDRRYRFAGVTFLLFLPLMIALHAKDYYVTPIYPVLFAAGAVAWQDWLKGRAKTAFISVYAAGLLIMTAIFLPMIVPILPPPRYLAYAHRLHFQSGDSENHAHGPLPQFFADRFGWRSLADQVANIYRSLPESDQRRVCIWGDNYGEASAVDILAPGLPQTISGHQNYFFWGPRGCHGALMILMGSDGKDLSRKFDSCRIAGALDDPYAMPYERRSIYLCRGFH